MAVIVCRASVMTSIRDRVRRASVGGLRRTGVAWVLATCLVVAGAGCGMNAQTLQPYTPAEGVNVDVGGQGEVQVRNLMILTRTPGEGFLSATLTATQPDTLTRVSGTAAKADGSDGAPLAVTLAGPVQIEPGRPVVLTDQPFITVRSPDLKAGLKATLVLRFGTAGEVSIQVPVVDGNQHEYKTVTPPAASPSPSV